LKLVNPFVFANTSKMTIMTSSLNSIDGEIFKRIRSLLWVAMDQTILRRISHRQGIKWIRQWNYGVNVNVMNLRDIPFTSHKYIEISETLFDRSRISQIFPQEDFCIYVDFPFKQFLILQKIFYFNKAIAIMIYSLVLIYG
jgi:hypothetical protein